MSVLTTTPLKSAPAAGAGVALTSGTSWTFGAWVQVIASTATPIAIAGVEFAAGSYASNMWELDIGIGGAGSEVSIGTLRLYLLNSGVTGTPNTFLLPVPLGGVGAGVRVAIRGRLNTGTGPTPVALLYYENLSSDQVSTSAQILGSGPSGSGTASITPSGTAWANSAWVPLIASAATDLGLIGLVHSTASGADNGVEFDLGTGAAGAETVITTLRQAVANGKVPYTWLPGIYPITAGTRVAVRMRKAGTSTTAHPVAVLYYTNVSAGPPPASALRLSQLTADVLLTPPPVDLRLSQLTAEALTLAPPIDLRLSQMAVDVLYTPPPPGGGAVPEAPAAAPSAVPVGVTRLFFELQAGTDASALAVMAAETWLSDPGTWFYGQKPGRLVTAASYRRTLADEIQGVDTRIVVADINGTFRTLANTHTLAGAYAALYAVSDETRYGRGEPTRLWSGKVADHRLKAGLYEFDIRDLLSERLADLDAAPRVPPDRLSLATFPMAEQNDGKALPIVIGVSSDALESGIPSNAQGVVPALYLGPTNLSLWGGPDQAVEGFVFSQSAIVWGGITAVYVNDPDHPETRVLIGPSDWGVNAWTPGKPGWPAPPAPQYLEAYGHRWTPFFANAAHPWAAAAVKGDTLIAANMYGIAEVADGSGRYLDDPAAVWQWLLVNQLIVPYTVGDYAPVPLLEPGYGLIDTASVARAIAAHDARIPGGYVVGFLLGRDGKQDTFRHVASELCFGTDMQQGINRHGQAMVAVEDPSAPIVATFTDRADIEDGTFEMWIDRDGWCDRIEATWGFRYWPPGAPKATPAEGQALPVRTLPPASAWTSGLQAVSHDAAIAANRGRVKTLSLENYVVRDTATATHWVQTKLARAVGPAPAYDGARMFRFTTGWQGAAVELGDRVRVFHRDAYAPEFTGVVLTIEGTPQQARLMLEGRVQELVLPPLPGAVFDEARWDESAFTV